MSLSAYFGAVPWVASKSPMKSPMLAPGAMPRPPTCAARGIGQIIAVEVRRGEHVVLIRTQQHLLEHRVGDTILDDDLAGRRFAAELVDQSSSSVTNLSPNSFFANFVAPVTERAFGVLHDVPLVHQRDRCALVIDRVLEAPCAPAASSRWPRSA